MRITLSDGLSVKEAMALTSQLAINPTQTERHFTFVGTFKPLTDNFFTDNAPFIDKGNTVEMLWKTIASDATGEMPVTVWNQVSHKFCFIEARVAVETRLRLPRLGIVKSTERRSFD